MEKTHQPKTERKSNFHQKVSFRKVWHQWTTNQLFSTLNSINFTLFITKSGEQKDGWRSHPRWRSHPCLWCKRNIGEKFKPQNLSPGGLIWAVVSMFHVSKTPSIISTNSKSICYTFRHQSAIKFVCLYFLFILFFATVFCEAKTSHPPARRDSGQIISS